MKSLVSWLAGMGLAGMAATLAAAAGASAATVVTLAPNTGHPGAPVTVTGSGFGDAEAVDVYVDTVDTLLLVTSSTGTLTGKVTIPAAATPGAHYVTAIGRRSGDAAQAPYTVTTPWAEYGFGAGRLAWNAYENVLTTSTAPSLGVLWSVANAPTGATPAILGGRAFVSTYAGLQALSTGTGAKLWSADASHEFLGSPAAIGNVVYAADYDGNMYAFNAGTGAVIWTKALGGDVYASPAVVGSAVYIANVNGSDGMLYALNASTGKTLWTFAAGGFDGSPTVIDGVVYIGCEDENVYALNATTGARIWAFPTGGRVDSTPSVYNNVLYVGSGDGNVYAVRLDGTTLWTKKTGDDVFASPAFANGTVFVGSLDGTMYALNAHTGATLWTVTTGAEIYGSAAVAGGVVYFTSFDQTLYGVAAASGSVLMTASALPNVYGGPAISDGVLYLSTGSVSVGSTYAFAPGAAVNAVPRRPRPPMLATLHPDFSLAVTQ